MRIVPAHPNRGIALIIVMVVITFFSIMVAGFAYSMKVETTLARNSGFDSEMTWLGRSGIELAKYVIAVQRTIPNEPYDSLNQKWAGGPGNSNSVLYDVTLENNAIGRGTVSVKITDCERKININIADEMVLTHALTMMGVDASETPEIVGSILDWVDIDDQTHPGGAENDFYQGYNPPFVAKNGPIDDMNELLLVKGVMPELFWGPKYSGPPSVNRRTANSRFGREPEPITYSVGMVDLFTPFATRFVNLNTASTTVLQAFPEIDENAAAAIIQFRAGPDGQDGTEDDTPFRNIAQLMAVPGIPPQFAGQLSRYFGTQSFTFEVEVTVKLDQRERKFFAILRRVDQRNVQTLNIWWK